MTAPWPFAQWGLNIMGPFLTAIRQLKFLVVGIDYFTKWVEVEALTTITEKNIRNLSGEISYAGIGYPEYWSLTTVSNSTTARSETFARN